MNHLKQISNKVLQLLLDILLLVYTTFKQLVLPSKKVKGNVLYSLFVFFIGIMVQLGSFEHGVFNMRALFKHKYARKIILLCSILLCLLSSFEWSAERPVVIAKSASNSTTQAPLPINELIISAQFDNVPGWQTHPKVNNDRVCTPDRFLICELLLTIKRSILFRSLQI